MMRKYSVHLTIQQGCFMCRTVLNLSNSCILWFTLFLLVVCSLGPSGAEDSDDLSAGSSYELTIRLSLMVCILPLRRAGGS
jgi:hypothetical protein